MAQIRINTDQMIAVANNFNSAILDEKKNAMMTAMENINSSWSGEFAAKLENETEDVKKALTSLSEEVKCIGAFLIAAVKAYCEADILGKDPIAEYNNEIIELPKDVDVTSFYLKEQKIDIPSEYKYKQSDSRWGGETLNGSQNRNSIGKKGCVLSCAAMVLSYRQKKIIMPHHLNKDTYVSNGDVQWGAFGMKRIDKKGASQQYFYKEIYKKLAEGKPVIAYAGGHAVVVTGYTGTEEVSNNGAIDASCFTIFDPGAGRKTLQKLEDDNGPISWLEV